MSEDRSSDFTWTELTPASFAGRLATSVDSRHPHYAYSEGGYMVTYPSSMEDSYEFNPRHDVPPRHAASGLNPIEQNISRKRNFDSIMEQLDNSCSDDEEGEGGYFEPPPAKKEDSSVTNRLLSFIQTVNTDIKRVFGGIPAEEHLNFEDARTKGKSGRQLYYEEMLRIARGTDEMDDDDSEGRDTHSESSSPTGQGIQGCTGRFNPHAGLGPLEELFAQVPKKHVPMTQRKLPNSFWAPPLFQNGTVFSPAFSSW